MKSKLILIGLVLIAVATLASPVLADESAPSLPAAFYGTAAYSTGDLLPAGSTLTATVEGITSTYILTESGRIGASGTFGEKFLVSGTTSGNSIVFSSGNIAAQQTEVFTPGSVKEINLVFAVTMEPVQVSPSSEAAAFFTENPMIIAKDGVAIPANLAVNVALITNTAILPTAPASITAFRFFEIDVANAESLNGEFSIILPITISDAELKASFQNNPDAVALFHSTGTAWEKVPIIRYEKKPGNTVFYAQLSSFSPYMLGVDTTKPTEPSDENTDDNDDDKTDDNTGGSSSPSSGSSTESSPSKVDTRTNTQTATPVSTTTQSPATIPASQPSQTSASPAPFVGLVLGLGAAALVYRLRR